MKDKIMITNFVEHKIFDPLMKIVSWPLNKTIDVGPRGLRWFDNKPWKRAFLLIFIWFWGPIFISYLCVNSIICIIFFTFILFCELIDYSLSYIKNGG